MILDGNEHNKYIFWKLTGQVLKWEHLDLFFKFFSIFGLRVDPSLLLGDMYRALSVLTSRPVPKREPSSFPMLHDAILALASTFSNDPEQEASTRHTTSLSTDLAPLKIRLQCGQSVIGNSVGYRQRVRFRLPMTSIHLALVERVHDARRCGYKENDRRRRLTRLACPSSLHTRT
jgi:hypothetical protein